MSVHHLMTKEELKHYGEMQFVSGERSALQWVLTCPGLHPNVRSHIENRVELLTQAINTNGANFTEDGTLPRKTDFVKGEQGPLQ